MRALLLGLVLVGCGGRSAHRLEGRYDLGAPGEGWEIRCLTEHHYHLVYNSPSPDEVMFGVLWSWAHHLRPPKYYFTVRILKPEKPGSEPHPTVFEVIWGPTPQRA